MVTSARSAPKYWVDYYFQEDHTTITLQISPGYTASEQSIQSMLKTIHEKMMVWFAIHSAKGFKIQDEGLVLKLTKQHGIKCEIMW